MFKKKPKVDWNLDYKFMKWLNRNFKKYKENASKFVDLEFHTYNYNGKEYTQLEIIDRVIELTDIITNDYYSDNDIFEKVDEVFDLFKLVYWNMWW